MVVERLLRRCVLTPERKLRNLAGLNSVASLNISGCWAAAYHMPPSSRNPEPRASRILRKLIKPQMRDVT